MTILRFIALIALFNQITVTENDSKGEVTRLEGSLASAGFLSNALKRDGSVNSEVERMLKGAFKSVKKLRPDNSTTCSTGSKIPEIIFTSIPNKRIKNESTLEECSEHMKKSELTPFSTQTKELSNISELNDWLAGFCRGKGKEGARLYEYCPGSCSPEYTYFITPNSNGYKMKAFSKCGLPRDTDDNRYKLGVGYRWTCADK